MRRINLMLTLAAVALSCSSAFAAATSGFSMNVVVNGSERTEYPSRGTIYIEALRGKDYAIRLTNSMPYRVAVALSVDGLNTIDARHTAAWDAAKWVLGPYESTVISGWQINQRKARRFYFTGETDSYGAKIGQIENLGIIEAVVYREREPVVTVYPSRPFQPASPADASARKESAPQPAAAAGTAAAGLNDDYAGTGMGRRTDHAVRTVDIDLNPTPVGSVRLRYEFRPQLVKLGILPPFDSLTPLERREHARGFDSYCPEP